MNRQFIPIERNARLDEEFEVAIILLQMASGLQWEPFLHKVYKENKAILDSANVTLPANKPMTNKRKFEEIDKSNEPKRKSIRPKKYLNYAQQMIEKQNPKKKGKVSWRKVVLQSKQQKKKLPIRPYEIRKVKGLRTKVNKLSNIDRFRREFLKRFSLSLKN